MCGACYHLESNLYFFNKTLRPIVVFLQNGLRNALFVDDFFLMVQQNLATDHRDFLLQKLDELGWQMNFQKSSLEPSTKCTFIGFEVSSCGPNGPWLKVLPKKLHTLS